MDKTRVLVVEDDVHLLEGIKDILELEGYQVLTAENGSNGLQVLLDQPTPPDLILSDIMMPRMDGIQFLKEVRKDQRWLTIPFIFLTAKGEKDDQHRGLRLGVDDYVVKPYDPADLLVKIEARLQRHRHLNDVHSSGMANLKRQILTMLNHEFRTPLTFVVAYADMLHNPGLQDLTPEEVRTYVNGVSTGADRLRGLIENFILLVELETGDARQTFEWRKTQITEIAAIFQGACAKVKEIEGHTWDIQIEGEIPIFTGDYEYLMAGIAQLLSNAVKFSPQEKPITAGAFVRDDQLTLWVKDEGRGIPESEFQNIWKSFYQINRTLNEDQGAGSGLAIVQYVAQLHGGSVAVESQLDAGSTFKIIIPLGGK